MPGEFERILRERLEESYAKKIAENTCPDCNVLFILDDGTRCGICGRSKEKT